MAKEGRAGEEEVEAGAWTRPREQPPWIAVAQIAGIQALLAKKRRRRIDGWLCRKLTAQQLKGIGRRHV